MHPKLQGFVRQTILDGLDKCTAAQNHLFKQMYAGGNMDKTIMDIVHDMPEEKLETAMDQVERTLEKANK